MSGLVRTTDDHMRLLADVHHGTHIAMDTETTGLSPYTVDEIRGISVAGLGWEWYLPISHPDSVNFSPYPLLERLVHNDRYGAPPKYLIFHHAVFDWAFLDQCTGPTWPGDPPVEPRWPDITIWDTQVVNWMIDENLKVGLKPSCERIFGYDAGEEQRALKAIKGRTWDTYTAEDIGQYAAMDARLTWDLWQWQMKHISDDCRPAISELAIDREMEVQRCLYRMIRTGIQVNPEKVAEGEGAFMEKIEGLAHEFEGVNPNSTKQVAEWVFHKEEGREVVWTPTVKTKTGKPCVAKNVLEDQALMGNPRAQILLDHRHLSKAVSGYFVPMKRQIGDDGRIHAHFSSTRTVTGRFSSSNPNLQTIPREDTMPEVRACFEAAPGYELWGFDLAQAELRVIAGYAGEYTMIDALENGRDLHSETAESIFGPDFTPLQRRLAKNLNFGFAYGIGPAKFATYFAPVPDARDVETARRILDGYKQTYPNVASLLTGMERVAKKQGYVSSHKPGRYRRFRGPGYQQEYYTAVNYIVQGGIGEFMKDVMVEWYRLYEDPCWRLVLQVHDELVFEVAKCPDMGGRIAQLEIALQGIADRLDPFHMKMIFEPKPWGHDPA